MFVKQIKEFDRHSGEADVIVTDGVYELMCYYHPAESVKIGTTVKEITSLFAEDIMRIDSRECLIRRENDYYSCYLCGEVIDRQIPKIAIGELEIKLDKPLAKDIKEGEFVEFKVSRLDCHL